MSTMQHASSPVRSYINLHHSFVHYFIFIVPSSALLWHHYSSSSSTPRYRDVMFINVRGRVIDSDFLQAQHLQFLFQLVDFLDEIRLGVVLLSERVVGAFRRAADLFQFQPPSTVRDLFFLRRHFFPGRTFFDSI